MALSDVFLISYMAIESSECAERVLVRSIQIIVTSSLEGGPSKMLNLGGSLPMTERSPNCKNRSSLDIDVVLAVCGFVMDIPGWSCGTTISQWCRLCAVLYFPDFLKLRVDLSGPRKLAIDFEYGQCR